MKDRKNNPKQAIENIISISAKLFAEKGEAVLQTMSAERVLEDVHEVTEYIKQQLNKDKIIIMGHSWGTVLGTMAVQTFPEDYSAYIGIAQVIKMADNERVGYEKTLEVAKAIGRQDDIKVLEAAAPYSPSEYGPSYMADMMTVRTYQSKYGADYQVPVYYIMGENDYNSPYLLAKAFFDEVVAPDKQIFSIPDAAHMPFLSNKVEFDRVLLEEIALKLKNP